ncbi:hypothetical protein [Myceligenerans salitolerans]|uniref:Secreted protein n=1 Tax=Myceligenerans salitolerans TaxID=1230528 RepID=A0ABS3I7J5_9MICO|nr:hypothetical protein [Myceligenerans salitolerans]MBO0608974.1 hypothetical protein [Myceligenerans salitolerans]
MITELRRRVGRGGVAMLATLALTLPAAGAATAAPSGATTSSESAALADVAAPAAESAWSVRTVERCDGNRIRHKAIKAGSHTIGWVNVFSEGGKKKCARVAHAGASWGKYRYTVIKVWNPNYGGVTDGSTVRYKSQAVRATGLRCVNVRGKIFWNGATRTSTLKNVCTG